MKKPTKSFFSLKPAELAISYELPTLLYGAALFQHEHYQMSTEMMGRETSKKKEKTCLLPSKPTIKIFLASGFSLLPDDHRKPAAQSLFQKSACINYEIHIEYKN